MAEPTWDDFPVVGQAPATMPNPQVPMQQGPVYGPAPTPQAPPSPTDQWVTLSPEEASGSGFAPGKIYQRNATGQIRVAGDATTDGTTATARKAIQTDETIGRIGEARELAKGWGTTGNFFGKSDGLWQSIPGLGQDAVNLGAKLEGLTGGVINDMLQELKALSPTGASGYGNFSEKEADRLAASIASIQQAQSSEELQKELTRLERHYRVGRAILDGVDPRIPENAAAYGLKVLPNGEIELDAGPPGGGGEQDNPFAGIIGEDGQPLGPEGGYGMDPETGEWGMYSRTSDTSADPRQQKIIEEAKRQDELRGQTNLIDLAGHGMSLGLTDEASGVGAAIAGALQGDFNVAENYATGRDVEQYRIDRARERYGTLGTIAEVAGGMSLPAGALAGSGRVADAARGGAIAGGVGGFGYGRGTEESLISAGIGAGGGALLGAGAQRFGNAMLSRPQGQGAQIQQAADDLGIDLLPADVGGTATRMATGATGRTLGGIPLAEAAERSIGTAAKARDAIASKVGQVSDDAGAGQALRRGADKFTKSSAARAEELYERISVPPEASVKLDSTRAALEDVTEGFRSNPKLSRLWANHPRLRATLEALTPNDVAAQARKDFMRASFDLQEAELAYQALRTAPRTQQTPRQVKQLTDRIDQLRRDVQRAQRNSERMPVGGELSWQDMKRFRSIVGEIVGQPGITSDGSDISALRKLYAALSSDMENTAAATSQRALTEFRRASQYWRGREARIEEVFASLFGKDGARAPEQAFRQINSWANKQGGDFARLSRAIRSMPQDEANIVRATVIQRMGMAKPGRQVGEGDVFSPAEFATQWQGLSNRAKVSLFPDKGHRESLEKLARVTEGMRGANQYANFSNTSLGVNATAMGALALSNPTLAAALTLGQFSAGKLLASPRFARWLVSGPRNASPAAQKAWAKSLGQIAKAEPSLAREIGMFQEAVTKAANDNPAMSTIAAQDQQQGN